MARAAAGVLAIVRSRVQASLLELLDGRALRAIDRAQRTDLAQRGDALLIVQTDGYGADLKARVVAEALVGAGATVELLDDTAAARYLDLEVSVVAHAGDGSLHPMLTTPRAAADGDAPPVRLLVPHTWLAAD